MKKFIDDSIVIEGPQISKGTVRIGGAKNSALPIIAASLINIGKVKLTNIPWVSDIDLLLQIVSELGVGVFRENNIVHLSVGDSLESFINPDHVRRMRASILLVGALLPRVGKVNIAKPGGCSIGVRPIDQHLKVFASFGAEIEEKNDFIKVEARKLQPTNFSFNVKTVTGTENALMLASSVKGKSLLLNCAQEPEIVDLASFLKKMGVKIKGAGSPVIEVEGSALLSNDITHSVIPDRIEAGTYVIVAAATGGEVTVLDCIPEHLRSLIYTLRKVGVEIETTANTIFIRGKERYNSQLNCVKTSPYPGFPTDLQAQFCALATKLDKPTTVVETIFENRFQHLKEMKKMGANFLIEGSKAVIYPSLLLGAKVAASDLRASASLVISALIAHGTTTITNLHHLRRGYEKLEEKLASLGVEVHSESLIK